MNRINFAAALALSGTLAWHDGQAHADVPLSGTFVARESCPALQSISKETNPGSVQTEPGRSYLLIAKNKPAASHFLIEIKGAEPPRRWVNVTCGEHMVPADGSRCPSCGTDSSGEDQQPRASKKPSYILSASWEPAFCEGKPGKPECKTESPQRFDASNFTLHGLWPQPKNNVYCNVRHELVEFDKDRKWDKLPDPNLDLATRRELDRVMPGTMSKLERHEWIKHGTCFDGEAAEDYFSRAIALIDQLNKAEPRELFASKVGSEVTNAEIRAAFDSAFGDGAGDRVRVSCERDGSRNLIVELTIGLAGEINGQNSLADLIAAAPPTENAGCPTGIVDAVGQQ